MPQVPRHEFRYDPARIWLYLKSLSTLVVMGSAFLGAYVVDAGPVGIAVIAVLAALTLWLALRLRHRVAVSIDELGIRFGIPGLPKLAWDDIESIGFRRIDGFDFLLIDRKSVTRTERAPNTLLQVAAKHAEAADLAVPLVHLADDPRRVYEIVRMALAIAKGGTAAQAR